MNWKVGKGAKRGASIALTATMAAATVGVVAPAAAYAVGGGDEMRRCTDIVLVSVPDNFDASATGNPSQPAGLFGEIADGVTANVGGKFSTVSVYYPTNVGLDGPAYQAAIDEGTNRGIIQIQNIFDGCSKSRVVIAGDGQGAQIAGNIMSDIGNDAKGLGIDSKRIEGGFLFGDPQRSPDTSTVVGKSQTNKPSTRLTGSDKALPQLVATTAPGQGLGGEREQSFGTLAGKVASFCSTQDKTCAANSDDQKNLIAQFGDVVFSGIAANSDKINFANPTATAAALAGTIGADSLRLLADQTGMPQPLISAETISMLVKVGLFAATTATTTAAGVPVIDPVQAMGVITETNQLPAALSELAGTIGQIPEIIAALPNALPTFYERSGIKMGHEAVDQIIFNVQNGNGPLEGIDLDRISMSFLPSSAQGLLEEAATGNLEGLISVAMDPTMIDSYIARGSYGDMTVGENGETSREWAVQYLSSLVGQVA